MMRKGIDPPHIVALTRYDIHRLGWSIDEAGQSGRK